MKKILLLVMTLLISISLISCMPQQTEKNSNNTENKIQTEDATTGIYDYNTSSQSSNLQESKKTTELSVFGYNYTNSEETILHYSGDDVTMYINVSNNSVIKFGMGISVVVNGIFVDSSIQQFTDENFDEAVGEKSSKSVFHQTDMAENETKYYSLSFKPDVFEKGKTVYAEIFCTLNNTYQPISDVVNRNMISTLRIYSSAVNIEVDKSADCEISDKCEAEIISTSQSDNLQSGFSSFNIYGKGDLTDLIISVNKGEKAEFFIDAKTDETCAEQTILISAVVNNEIYPAFDGKNYLQINTKKNMHYKCDFSIDTTELKEINNLYFYAEVIDADNEYGYNSMITPSNEFMFIKTY